MVCVFAFILSFGLGPGEERQRLLFDSHCWFFMLFLLPRRWSDKHLEHWALHSDGPAGRLRDRGVGELAQLLLHRSGLPFRCGRCLGSSRANRWSWTIPFVPMTSSCSSGWKHELYCREQSWSGSWTCDSSGLLCTDRPTAVLFPGLLSHLLLNGNVHFLHHSWDQEQNIPGNPEWAPILPQEQLRPSWWRQRNIDIVFNVIVYRFQRACGIIYIYISQLQSCILITASLSWFGVIFCFVGYWFWFYFPAKCSLQVWTYPDVSALDKKMYMNKYSFIYGFYLFSYFYRDTY